MIEEFVARIVVVGLMPASWPFFLMSLGITAAVERQQFGLDTFLAAVGIHLLFLWLVSRVIFREGIDGLR